MSPTHRRTPVAPTPVQPPKPRARTEELFGPSSGILVIEDSPDLREAMADVLLDEGYTVMTASDGRDALTILEACRPALLVMDLMMPTMSGFELLELMKCDPALASIPVLVVTASIDHGVRDHRVLQKPIMREALLREVREILE